MKNPLNDTGDPICPVCLEEVTPGQGGARPNDYIVHYRCWDEAFEMESSPQGYEESPILAMAK